MLLEGGGGDRSTPKLYDYSPRYVENSEIKNLK
jgi:hypothetical protein